MDTINRTGVNALGLLRLSRRAPIQYNGRLTSWPQHAAFLWNLYHRPVDAVSVKVISTWFFREPVSLHHRESVIAQDRESRRVGNYEQLDGNFRHHLFSPWPDALENRADTVIGDNGHTLKHMLGEWGLQGHQLKKQLIQLVCGRAPQNV